MHKFPAWLYHQTEAPRIFHDAETHDAAIEAGWVDTPAKLAKPEADMDIDGEDKEALLAQAKALGIDAKGTWGVKKLKEAIAANLDAE